MDRKLADARLEKLLNEFRGELRGFITRRSDIHEGLILVRNRLQHLSSDYDRNVLHHICTHFVQILTQKLHYPPATGTLRAEEAYESTAADDRGTDLVKRSPALSFLVGQVMAEVDLANRERGPFVRTKGVQSFVKFQPALIQDWYRLSIQERLTWRQALVYLGTVLAVHHLGGKATKDQICEYVSLAPITISRHLTTLLEKGLVQLSNEQVDEKSEIRAKAYQIEYFSMPDHCYLPVPDTSGLLPLAKTRSWFSDLNLFSGKPPLTWAPYTPWIPKDVKSPVIRVERDSVDCHERALSAVIVMAGCLTEEQILDFMKALYGREYQRRMVNMRGNLEETTNQRFTIPDRLHPHYDQIAQVLPILMYASRRTFTINPTSLLTVQSTLHSEIKMAFHDLLVNAQFPFFPNPQGSNNPPKGWNIRCFAACFLFHNPFQKWHARYPKINPTIPMGYGPRVPNQWVTLDEKRFKLDFLEQLARRSQLADSLVRVIRLFIQKQTLRRLRKGTLDLGTLTPRSLTQTLDNASHRTYFVDTPRQAVPKPLRHLFQARPRHNFLIVDIEQTDLELWKGVSRAILPPGLAKIPDIDFTEIAKASGLARSVVKGATYRYFYGASKNNIMFDLALTITDWRKLNSQIFRYFTTARNHIQREASQQGYVRATPLRYRIPMNRRYYRAPALFAQAVGAELLRQWILNLHHAKLSPYIVNLIHDEIIFELPSIMNLYDTAEIVQTCLNEAVTTILPEATLRIKATAGRRWGSDANVLLG